MFFYEQFKGFLALKIMGKSTSRHLFPYRVLQTESYMQVGIHKGRPLGLGWSGCTWEGLKLQQTVTVLQSNENGHFIRAHICCVQK